MGMGVRWRRRRGRLLQGGMLGPCLASMTSPRCSARPPPRPSAAASRPVRPASTVRLSWSSRPPGRPAPATRRRWVRLAVGLAAEEYQLGNAELEAIQRVRGGVGADRDGSLVRWVAQVDRRPRAELLGDGVLALVWLRAFTW